MELGKALVKAIKAFRLIIQLTFFSIFAYWSYEAFKKLSSKPVTSSVTFSVGDDGKGNVTFPTVSVCLDSYSGFAYAKKKLFDNCTSPISTFAQSLKVCTAENHHADFPTTTENGLGGLFTLDKPTTRKVENIDAFLQLIRLDVTDMISTFEFSNSKVQVGHGLAEELRKGYIKEYWEPIIHPQWGYCFSFDVTRHNLTNMPISGYVPLGLTINFDFLKLLEFTSLYANYFVLIHESLSTFYDAYGSQPSLVIEPNSAQLSKISKTTINAMSTEDNPCLLESQPLLIECSLNLAQEYFENKYRCTLPWMKSKKFTLCSIKNDSRNTSYSDLVVDWTNQYDLFEKNNCTLYQKCKRSVFHQLLRPLSSQEAKTKTNGALLTISFDGPNIQKISDSYSYDFQSFIGEVGGTLGLFLGLSFLSIVEFAEIWLAKLFNH